MAEESRLRNGLPQGNLRQVACARVGLGEMTTIKAAKMADLVSKHIEDLILEGSLLPGEALLSERELAERLNVSRPTLRDGLKLLEDRGLLTGKEGRGLKVAQLGAAAIADPLIDMLSTKLEVADDYLEFRDIIESSAAAIAAERATEIDRQTIDQCLDRIDRAHTKGDPAEEADADTNFHMKIYEACHNLVILQIMRAFSGKLRADVLHNRERLFKIPFTRDLLLKQHRSIGEAILKRDPVAAKDAAHAHLDYLRKAMHEIRQNEANLDTSLRRLQGGGIVARKASR